MRRSLLDILVDPISKTPLQVEVHKYGAVDNIVEGVLNSIQGRSYPITNGIPRFVLTQDSDQRQTAKSFAFQWQQRYAYDSPQVNQTRQQWMIERYGFKNLHNMQDFFSRRRRILDAGCGSGVSTSWMNQAWLGKGKAEWVGIDISTAIDVALERLGFIENTNFIQADILQLPFKCQIFDTIIAEGVLHHTPSTELALKSLVSVLEPRGEIMFYVYRKKGPIREFTDDYIRNIVSSLDPDEAWAILRSLTKLGQALTELRKEIEVPEDIPYLNIKAGRYDVQRFIYWHFAKLFWNERFSFEENNLENFDWYYPRYAHRHTREEILGWCRMTGLSVTHFDSDSGFTVRAIKD